MNNVVPGALVEGRIIDFYEGNFTGKDSQTVKYTNYEVLVRFGKKRSIVYVKCYEELNPQVQQDSMAVFSLGRQPKPYQKKDGSLGVEYMGDLLGVIKEGGSVISQVLGAISKRTARTA